MSRKIIDIHNHSLYCVDDGAKSREESVAILQDAAGQGVKAVIYTPHYRHGMFPYNNEVIEEHFEDVREVAEDMGLSVYLGCEYHVNSNVVRAFQEGRCHSLADTDYVLTEYAYGTEYAYIVQYTQQLLACGYIPVIAHVERYECIQKKPLLCRELASMGAWIQVNADSVLGLEGMRLKHVCKKLLKDESVDIIASDAHGIKERASHMGKCYEYVSKKYGEACAERVFWRNPGRIIEDSYR